MASQKMMFLATILLVIALANVDGGKACTSNADCPKCEFGVLPVCLLGKCKCLDYEELKEIVVDGGEACTSFTDCPKCKFGLFPSCLLGKCKCMD